MKLWLRYYKEDNSYILRVQLLDTSATSATVQPPADLTELTLGANQLLIDWKDKQYNWKGGNGLGNEDEREREEVMMRIKKWKNKGNRMLMKEFKGETVKADSVVLKRLEIRTFKFNK